MKSTLRLLSLLALPSLGACGATFATLDYSTVSPKVVEVDLDSTGPGKFTLRVKNLGDQPLTIHRDQVVLRTVKGDRIPLPPQNGSDVETVNPGATLPIIVRYSTQDLPDDTMVSLRFEKAFTTGDAQAPAPSPMKFKVGGTNSST
jgi:hypothetical protein